MSRDAQTYTHFQNLLLVWNTDLTEKLEMDWTEALETLAHTKCTWMIYEKRIVFFPFLYTGPYGRWQKLVSWPHLLLLCGRCQVSSFLRVEWTSWTRELFFQASRHKVSMFPGKHTFHGPQYSRPQLIWTSGSNIFHNAYFKNIYLYTSPPQTVNALWTKQSHCIPILFNLSNNRVMCMMS